MQDTRHVVGYYPGIPSLLCSHTFLNSSASKASSYTDKDFGFWDVGLL